MIILDERNYLKSELDSKGFSIFDFFEAPQVLDMKAFTGLELKRRGDFLLVDTQTLLNHPQKIEEFKSIMNTFVGAIFFHEHANTKAHDWVQNEGSFLTKIIGEYSLPMPQLNWTMLSNQLQFFWNLIQDQRALQKHMMEFSRELDQVIQSAEVEMVKAKKIHEAFIPKRSEEIKGVHFFNRYASGDGGGAEFYDLHQTPTKVYQILISSQSYLISSSILGILSKNRDQSFNPVEFIKDALHEVEVVNGVKKKKSDLDLVVLELDLGTLQLKSLTESKAELYSQVHGAMALTKDTVHTLTRGEKLIVFSSGFLFNWSEGLPQKKLHDFLKSNSGRTSHELMPELFFELNNSKEGKFLKKDATVVMMEVNRHGIHKV